MAKQVRVSGQRQKAKLVRSRSSLLSTERTPMKFRSIPVSRKDGKILLGSLCTDHLLTTVGLFADFRIKAVLLHLAAVAARRIVDLAWETRELQLFKTLDVLLNVTRAAGFRYWRVT